jgi:hypothetical protein
MKRKLGNPAALAGSLNVANSTSTTETRALRLGHELCHTAELMRQFCKQNRVKEFWGSKLFRCFRHHLSGYPATRRQKCLISHLTAVQHCKDRIELLAKLQESRTIDRHDCTAHSAVTCSLPAPSAALSAFRNEAA